MSQTTPSTFNQGTNIPAAQSKGLRNRASINATRELTYRNRKTQSELDAALAYCADNLCKAKAAISGLKRQGMLLEYLTFEMVKYALTNKEALKDKRAPDTYHRDGRELLLHSEKMELAEWAASNSRVNDPKSRTQISAQARFILTTRQAANTSHNTFSQYRVPLTQNELNYLGNLQNLSDEWFNRWYAEYDKIIQRKQVEHMSSRRTVKKTEETVTNHFNTLEYNLIRMGIMDPTTKMFDPRRLINMDETPEFFYNPEATSDGNSQVTAGADEKRVFKSTAEARDTYTVNMCVGADGFQYGPQLIFKTANEGSIAISLDETTVKKLKEQFDNTIDESHKVSKYCLIACFQED